MKSYVIHLIRHGLTQANLNGAYAGVTDIPVCKQGEERLLNLKENYKYPTALEFYTSPMIRCKQTCDILYPGSNPKVINDLKEWNFGDWEGKSYKELMETDERYRKWIENNRQSAVPNGESGEEFFKRICKSFEEIVYSLIKRGVTSAAVFTHGGVIMSILSTYSLEKSSFLDWIVDNGCGYSVRIMPSLWMRDKVLEVFQKIPEGANTEINGEFKKLIEDK